LPGPPQKRALQTSKKDSHASKMLKIQFGSTLDVGDGRSFLVGGQEASESWDLDEEENNGSLEQLTSDGEERQDSGEADEVIEEDWNSQNRSFKIEYERYHEQVLNAELRDLLVRFNHNHILHNL